MISVPKEHITISEIDQSTEVTVFANWRAAFFYNRTLDTTGTQVIPVLARLDEYDYWFFGGTQDSNDGRTLITAPPK